MSAKYLQSACMYAHGVSRFGNACWDGLWLTPLRTGPLACTLFNTVDPSWQHHSASSTDTSTCYQHLVSWTMYRHIIMLSPLWVRHAHHHAMWMMRMCWFFLDAMLFCNNFMFPKRRFWKDGQKKNSGFSKHFSRAWVLDLGHEPLKRYSKIMNFLLCYSFQNLR